MNGKPSNKSSREYFKIYVQEQRCHAVGLASDELCQILFADLIEISVQLRENMF